MKMKLCLPVLAAAILTSCIDSQTTITVKPDGSGTIEERVIMGTAVTSMMKQMSGAFGGDTTQTPENMFYKVEELKSAVSQYGEGVTYKSSQPIRTTKGEGWKVVYTFEDINAVRINQNPGDKVPSAGGEPAKNAQEEVLFEFKKRGNAILKINRPDKDIEKSLKKTKNAKTSEPGDTISDENMEMVKKMFEGLRIAVFLKIDGTIITTNAQHRNGNVITYMDMDYSKLVGNKEALKTLSTLQSVEAAKVALKNIPGITVDTNDELMVTFK